MARIDFPNTKEGIGGFEQYMSKFVGTGRMYLFITKRNEVILRPSVASRLDTAYVSGLDESQVKEIENKFDKDCVFHVDRFHWRDEVPERLEA